MIGNWRYQEYQENQEVSRCNKRLAAGVSGGTMRYQVYQELSSAQEEYQDY
jgi:hypothetical protein